MTCTAGFLKLRCTVYLRKSNYFQIRCYLFQTRQSRYHCDRQRAKKEFKDYSNFVIFNTEEYLRYSQKWMDRLMKNYENTNQSTNYSFLCFFVCLSRSVRGGHMLVHERPMGRSRLIHKYHQSKVHDGLEETHIFRKNKNIARKRWTTKKATPRTQLYNFTPSR